MNDEKLAAIFWSRCPLVRWLCDNGLRFDMPDGIDKMVLEADDPKLPPDPPLKEGEWRMESLPLPITHEEFADRDMADAEARRVGERVEEAFVSAFKNDKNALRQSRSDMTNLPTREALVRSFCDRKYYGPYVVVCSKEEEEATKTVVMPCERFQAVVATAVLKEKQQIIFQATPDVIRAVVAEGPKLLPWDKGWMFRCCIVPQLRRDWHGNLAVAWLGDR
jgi:hypothetical protein